MYTAKGVEIFMHNVHVDLIIRATYVHKHSCIGMYVSDLQSILLQALLFLLDMLL